MPRTHRRHQPGMSLGEIDRANGDVLQIAECAGCPAVLVKDVNWRTFEERARAVIPAVAGSLI